MNSGFTTGWRLTMRQTSHFFGRVIATIGRFGRRNKLAVLSSAAVVVVGLSFLWHVTALAQQKYEGQWLIEAKPGSDKVNLSLHYHTGKNKPDDGFGFNSNTSFDIAPSQFSGLTEAQVMSATGGHVEFQLRRDPGDLNF